MILLSQTLGWFKKGINRLNWLFTVFHFVEKFKLPQSLLIGCNYYSLLSCFRLQQCHFPGHSWGKRRRLLWLHRVSERSHQPRRALRRHHWGVHGALRRCLPIHGTSSWFRHPCQCIRGWRSILRWRWFPWPLAGGNHYCGVNSGAGCFHVRQRRLRLGRNHKLYLFFLHGSFNQCILTCNGKMFHGF